MSPGNFPNSAEGMHLLDGGCVIIMWAIGLTPWLLWQPHLPCTVLLYLLNPSSVPIPHTICKVM